MRKTLLVTNDFPPRAGGIQTFLEGFVGQLDPQQLIVYASTPPDGPEAARHYDEQQPYTVVRYPGTTMLPTPHVSRTMVDLIRAHGVKNVWFGAAAPLGLMAHAAHKAGAEKVIATTHGHEIGWSMIPGARHMLRKVFADADVVTYLTHATLRRLSPSSAPPRSCSSTAQSIQSYLPLIGRLAPNCVVVTESGSTCPSSSVSHGWFPEKAKTS